jgi:hypothetical protein
MKPLSCGPEINLNLLFPIHLKGLFPHSRIVAIYGKKIIRIDHPTRDGLIQLRCTYLDTGQGIEGAIKGVHKGFNHTNIKGL